MCIGQEPACGPQKFYDRMVEWQNGPIEFLSAVMEYHMLKGGRDVEEEEEEEGSEGGYRGGDYYEYIAQSSSIK